MSAEERLVLHQLESELQAELRMVQSGHADEDPAPPQADWLFDPSDVERYRIGVNGLLGAVQAVEETRSRTPRMTVPPSIATLTVADVMVGPQAIEGDAHLAAAAYLMHHTTTPALVVEDEHHHMPVTLLTERDVLRAVAHGGNAAEERVTTWATSTSTRVTPGASLTDAIDLMLDLEVRALPVHDAEHGLVGVLDLLSSIRANRSTSPSGTVPREV